MDELLVATFDKEEPQDLFWRYVDYIINIGATAKGIVVGIDNILISIDAFCDSQNITTIAPLYRSLLAHSGYGEFMGAKFICHYKDEWLKRFPNGVTYKTKLSDMSTLQSYKQYLEQHDMKYELSLLDFYLNSTAQT